MKGVIHKIFKSRSQKEGDFFVELQETLGFSPGKLRFYQRAFTHRSLQKRDKFGNELNYERLEFLGDAVLGTVIAAYLFDELPQADEGHLTKMRAKIVSRQALNNLGKNLDLLSLMEIEPGQGQVGENIHGNLLEALIGAIFEDRGFKYCQKFIHEKIIKCYLDIERLEDKIISYKSHVIEWCQKEKLSFEFEGKEDFGNESIKHFSVSLWVSGNVVAKARSTSKKKAEEKAARRAYFALQHRIAQ